MEFTTEDRRTEEQKQADREVLESVERGAFFPLRDLAEGDFQAALDWKRERLRSRRIAARIAQELGSIRRAMGLTQKQVADAMQTHDSAVSRVESGEYGGITVERLISTFFVMVGLYPGGLVEVRRLLSRQAGAASRILLDLLDEALEDEAEVEHAQA